MLWPAMDSPTPGSSPGSGISKERPEMPNFLNIFFNDFFSDVLEFRPLWSEFPAAMEDFCVQPVDKSSSGLHCNTNSFGFRFRYR